MKKITLILLCAGWLVTVFTSVNVGILMEREAHRQAWYADNASAPGDILKAGTENVGTKFHWGPRGIWADEKPQTDIWASPETKAAPASVEITPMGWNL